MASLVAKSKENIQKNESTLDKTEVAEEEHQDDKKQENEPTKKRKRVEEEDEEERKGRFIGYLGGRPIYRQLFKMDYHDTPEISRWFKENLADAKVELIAPYVVFYVRKYRLPSLPFPDPLIVKWLMREPKDWYMLCYYLNDLFRVQFNIEEGPKIPPELSLFNEFDLELKSSGQLWRDMNRDKLLYEIMRDAAKSIAQQDFLDDRDAKLAQMDAETRAKCQAVLDQCKRNQPDFIEKNKSCKWFDAEHVHWCAILSGNLTKCKRCDANVCDNYLADVREEDDTDIYPMCKFCSSELDYRLSTFGVYG